MALVAERPGQLICKSQPFVHVLSQSQRGKRCDECFTRSSQPLLKCSACAVMRYCNAACQRKAWDVHKEECKCFKRVSPNVPKENVRILFQLLIRVKNNEHVNLQEHIFDNDRSFANLISHGKELQGDHKRMEDFSTVCQTLKAYVGNDIELPSMFALLEMYGKMTVNSFAICDGEMQSIGTGIYLGPSILNHDCRPTAVASFNGTELSVRSLGKIEEPEEVVISYIDQLGPTSERRNELCDQYYFTCRCSMCTDTSMNNMMLASKCPSKGCNGNILEIEGGKLKACPLCGKDKFDETYSRQKRQITMKSILEHKEMKKLKAQNDTNAILQKAESLIKEQAPILPYTNIYVVRTIDWAFDACIDLALWQKALEYGKLNIDPFWQYYHKLHPNVGILLMKIGKIQLYLHHLEEAYKMLQQAEAILKVTHSSNHALYGDLCSLLSQCAEEMRMKLSALKL